MVKNENNRGIKNKQNIFASFFFCICEQTSFKCEFVSKLVLNVSESICFVFGLLKDLDRI